MNPHMNPHLMSFAAHVALLLNKAGPEGDVRPAEAALWIRLMDLLATPKRPYAREIVGVHLMELGDGPSGRQQAVARWFEEVFDRPLEIRDGFGFHQAHALFASMASRTPEAGEVALIRGAQPAAGRTPETLRHAAERLSLAAEASDDAGRGQITGPKGAPLWLKIDGGSLRMPLNFSLWSAFHHAPRVMRLLGDALPPGRMVSERRIFIHLSIRAFEAANARWGKAVALGLSPWTYRHISTNQMIGVQRFIVAAGGRRASPPRADLERSWLDRPVPHFEDLDHFLASDIGRELFFIDPPPRIVSYDEGRRTGDKEGAPRTEEEPSRRPKDTKEMKDATLWPEAPEEQEERPPPDPATVAAVVEELFTRGLIDEIDQRIYLGLIKKEKDALKRIWRQAWAQEAFPAFADLLDHADILVGRVAQAVQALRDGPSTQD